MSSGNSAPDLVDVAEHEVMRERLRHLKCATMLPGGFDKRFINDVWQREPAKLTMKQHDFVMLLAWRYRRQMPSELVPKVCPDNRALRQSERERG